MSRAPRRFWTERQIALLRELYPHQPTRQVAFRIKRSTAHCYAKANDLGLHKTPQFFADAKASGRFDGLTEGGRAHRFPKGHAPANKGLRRPGWHSGRMRDTMFKKGQFPPNRDPDYYVIGALRINTDGYIDMRISFEPGGRGWRGLHRILWEDAHGPIPKGHVVVFKNRDRLDAQLDNLELITQRDNMLRNSVHNLPKPLVEVIRLRAAVKSTITRRNRAANHEGAHG